jgi:succinate dehydrogenase / fumarate reductase cytochrome b subunit
MAPHPRPISPHLSVYRFTLTMLMSIAHRATGIALYVGTLLLVLYVLGAALGGDVFDSVNALFGSWFGHLVLFGYTWVLFHHLFGGLRYFVWDRLMGMDPAGRELIVRIQVVAAPLLTLAVWAIYVWFK